MCLFQTLRLFIDDIWLFVGDAVSFECLSMIGCCYMAGVRAISVEPEQPSGPFRIRAPVHFSRHLRHEGSRGFFPVWLPLISV